WTMTMVALHPMNAESFRGPLHFVSELLTASDECTPFTPCTVRGLGLRAARPCSTWKDLRTLDTMALDRIRRQHLALGLGLGLGALHCAGTRDANAPGMAGSSTDPPRRFTVASETGS